MTLNRVDENFGVRGQARFCGARLTGEKEGICSNSVRNVGTSSAVFVTAERARKKLGIGRIRREFRSILSYLFHKSPKLST